MTFETTHDCLKKIFLRFEFSWYRYKTKKIYRAIYLAGNTKSIKQQRATKMPMVARYYKQFIFLSIFLKWFILGMFDFHIPY